MNNVADKKRAENLIGAAPRQINPALGVTIFSGNLKQKTQILSVLIAHANTIPIMKRAKYGSAECK